MEVAAVSYSVYTDTRGKKQIHFGNAYLPSVNYVEILKVISKEFPNISPENLEIRVEGTAWYYSWGSFKITVTEV